MSLNTQKLIAVSQLIRWRGYYILQYLFKGRSKVGSMKYVLVRHAFALAMMNEPRGSQRALVSVKRPG